MMILPILSCIVLVSAIIYLVMKVKCNTTKSIIVVFSFLVRFTGICVFIYMIYFMKNVKVVDSLLFFKTIATLRTSLNDITYILVIVFMIWLMAKKDSKKNKEKQ